MFCRFDDLGLLCVADARFWIALNLGKHIYPEPVAGVPSAAPAFISLAESCFGTRFLQGFHWG